MSIDRYFDRIKRVIDKFGATPFVLETSVVFDARPGDQGHLTGSMRFIDGSFFHFREFIDMEGDDVEKPAYSYHYQDHHNQVIFRYDNANHKPALSFQDHKHANGKIVESETPALEDVLIEILSHGVMDRGRD